MDLSPTRRNESVVIEHLRAEFIASNGAETLAVRYSQFSQDLMPTDDPRTSDHDSIDNQSQSGLSIRRQAVFGADGLEVERETVKTSLTDYGIEAGRQRSTRLAVPMSEGFVDDRPQMNDDSPHLGEQGLLFASITPGQRTLDGCDATIIPLFDTQIDK